MENKDSRAEAMQVELKVPCEVYSRIVGYLRPVQNWHAGKQQEFRERKLFQVSNTAVQEEGAKQV
jgi:anaerobic ribonucleoside-triphosphate reductase